ncbi:hypothetical protein [Microbacterium sp. TNHR37B]|uniref:hypothetical protein n=1 Tax=Microbacterium sp. TNHR37B TaxID=1775956 RepID=UPI0007B1BA29|nr:hypothetical protein [Microbacterium sp. TNHR37B]KZE89447.1 hypothetical protein AVP41_02242 [Microbacterium sp. TNHR37B]
MPLRRLPALSGILLAAVLLSGCASAAQPGGSEPGGSNPGSGGSPSVAPPADGDGLDVGAAWLSGGSAIAVVTPGSSSPACAPLVDEVVLDQGVLVVSLSTDPAAACTRDLVPRGTLVGLPGGVDPAKGLPVQVTLDDSFGEAELAPYAGAPVEEYSPSAGWVDDGVLALLTWGSSSCAPVVESARAESPTEVVVTFAKVTADQPCTMDMAPRVAVATVEGEVSRDATLSFVGGDRFGGGSIAIG